MREHVVVDRALIDVSLLGTLSRAIRVNLASNLIQRAPRMKAATFVLNSASQRNIQPLLQSVCHVIGCVLLQLKLSSSLGHFVTKLFHPNVSSSGEICVNTLKKDWQPSFGISHILLTIKCLLIYPNPESALDEEAGKLLLEDYAEFEKRAKLICEVHAQPKVRLMLLYLHHCLIIHSRSAPLSSTRLHHLRLLPAPVQMLHRPPLQRPHGHHYLPRLKLHIQLQRRPTSSPKPRLHHPRSLSPPFSPP